MKTIVDQVRRAEELRNWRGADALVWMFHASHRRLALMLSRPTEPSVLYLVAVGCKHFTGPFSWGESHVAIAEAGDGANIVDDNAGFKLECSSVTLVIGPSTDYDTSFEGFVGDGDAL